MGIAPKQKETTAQESGFALRSYSGKGNMKNRGRILVSLKE